MDIRKIEERFFQALMIASTLLISGALGLIIATILWKGLPALSIQMLTQVPKGGYNIGTEGGILNAILGSIYVGIGSTALAFLLGLPVVYYIHLYLPRGSRVATALRFFLDVLWGIPSIVYGAFGFTVMVFLGLRASMFAAIVTVALLVLPIMIRTMDEVFKMISPELFETAYALGSTRLEVAIKIASRKALPGILTAVLISFGRGIGDAASVLFTAGFTDSLPTSLFMPVATLPLAIFFQLGTPFPEVQQRGYASAFVLTVILLAVSLTARILSNKRT